MNEELDLITSHLSGTVTRCGTRVWLEIFRLGDQAEWTLEVINEAGTSIVWDHRFVSPDAAYAAFRAALDEKGIDAFQDEPEAVSFPMRRMAQEAQGIRLLSQIMYTPSRDRIVARE